MKLNKQAFTLIELVVVVLIIGILAAVAVPQYQISVAKSRFARLKLLVKSIVQAQEVYFLANGKYAIDLAVLDVDLPAGYEEEKDRGENDEVTKIIYLFDGWECRSYGTAIACRTEVGGIDVFYKQYYEKGNLSRSKWEQCIAYTTDLDHLSNRLCKLETGLIVPTHTPKSAGYTEWKYN
ncbi:MAG: prepilin-type N-terminal cleavage/methylation domain-containing protein [Elusimicrobiaceae bacterium]|nr:prepilin-type N-terminal cleavage/methylation domain-containing protein [Elusimicrobiaceae bacterium]